MPADAARVTRRARLGGPPRFGWFALAFTVGLTLACGWSVQTLLSAPDQVGDATTYTTATTQVGTVERILNLNADATWDGGAPTVGMAAGTVTAVHAAGPTAVGQGTVLYEVDLQPVVAARGNVPAFRDLRRGDAGPDVKQLQELLRTAGHFTGAATSRFDAVTVEAVRDWQRGRGQPRTGEVRMGTVLFVGELPATGATTPAVVLGQAAPVGVAAFRTVPDAPRFTMQLPANQALLVKPDMPVHLQHGSAAWEAVVDSIMPGPDGTAMATLGSATGGRNICGQECRSLSLDGVGGIVAAIQVTPRTVGTTVPTAALVVSQNGGAAVTTDSGEVVPVRVRASSSGVAVVEGIQPGVLVRVGSGAR